MLLIPRAIQSGYPLTGWPIPPEAPRTATLRLLMALVEKRRAEGAWRRAERRAVRPIMLNMGCKRGDEVVGGRV